ncbi:FAD-binding oxidoreductase [Massilia sp. IC2-477]|uniref:FAD-binding oxidoreductase n=1 Tax=Massilia sp. IC2-477 TaxID=2887198 RepID=UPI001D11F5F2|nr:FAD-binding oxidoreductase [Massilia sp. IC2-477]MCC2957933.1 FAD-binding oxidoreductase [Massilia sp. IC2-477]
MHPSRRRFLVQAMAGAGLLSLSPLPAVAAPGILIPNVTGLYPVEVARVAAPASTEEVAQAVRDWPGRIAVGGGRYSMGSQVAIRGGLHLDMRGMNRLLLLDPQAKTARVQAGMRWRELQDALDPLGLAVHTMQSFANFTVGGAVSVNAHGRYVGNGPVVNSVRALQLVLADGSVVEATRSRNAELFRAAVGGYGAVGIITEVELDLARNTRIERQVEEVSLDDYPAWFRRMADQGDCVFHNADLLPPLFDAPVAVSWRRSTKALTETARLVPRGQSYGLEQNALFAMTELPRGDLLRSKLIHPLLLARPAVKWRNHEASLDVGELEPRTRSISTYVLQEYFIPVRHFAAYARAMAAVIRKHGARVLNVSVRHSPADSTALLPWAKEEVFSFVVYYKQRTHAEAQRRAGDWTREMIETALAFGGRYYLPYQLHATRSQFERAYPEAQQLREIKRRVDPGGRLSNALWAAYLQP